MAVAILFIDVKRVRRDLRNLMRKCVFTCMCMAGDKCKVDDSIKLIEPQIKLLYICSNVLTYIFVILRKRDLVLIRLFNVRIGLPTVYE